MNYHKVYQSLINRAHGRTIEGYVEKHHIVPRCLGGSDEEKNLVRLTAREHFVAHQLLTRMHPGVRGLSWAALLMAGKEKFNPGLSRQYEFLKRVAVEDIARQNSGKRQKPKSKKQEIQYASRLGIPLSDEVKAKISAAHKGRFVSEQTRKKMRDAAKNRPPMSEERKENLREMMRGNSFRKGIPNSPELKERIRLASLGRVHSKEEREKRAASRRRITDEQIRCVRLLHSENPKMTYAQIAYQAGTSATQVGRIINGHMYSEVL